MASSKSKIKGLLTNLLTSERRAFCFLITPHLHRRRRPGGLVTPGGL